MVAERVKAESEDHEEELDAERIMEEFTKQENQVKRLEGFNAVINPYNIQLRMAVERIGEEIGIAKQKMDNKPIDILTY